MALQGGVNFEPHKIFAAVKSTGTVGAGPFLDGEFHGGECRVLKLSFKDEASVAVRVLHPKNSSHDNIIATVQSEVHVLKELEGKGFPWAPRCLGASLTFDNPIEHPFVVLTWAEGFPLDWDEHHPPQTLRNRLLDQIASIQLCLIQCTLQAGPSTATTYFERRMRNRLRRVQNGDIPELTEKDCLDQQALLDLVLGEDRNNTLFAVDHGDVKPENIIVDKDYNIICVIDWGFASLVPIAKAAGLPRFLWPSLVTPPSRIILEDRQTYVRSLSSHTSLAALSMLRWQGNDDVDFRTLYLESITSKGVHISMARIGWKAGLARI
jgi:serine/threonine protein kinase